MTRTLAPNASGASGLVTGLTLATQLLRQSGSQGAAEQELLLACAGRDGGRRQGALVVGAQLRDVVVAAGRAAVAASERDEAGPGFEPAFRGAVALLLFLRVLLTEAFLVFASDLSIAKSSRFFPALI